jgi:hypothetical protein
VREAALTWSALLEAVGSAAAELPVGALSVSDADRLEGLGRAIRARLHQEQERRATSEGAADSA